MTPKVKSISDIPAIELTAAVTSVRRRSFIGQPEIVSNT